MSRPVGLRPARLTALLLPVVLVASGLSLIALPAKPAKADPLPPTVSERYAEKVMDDNPAAYYRLDDATAGFARDSSGNFRDGTHGANVTPGVDGLFANEGADDKALASPGTVWAFTAPGTGMPSGSRSVELWVKTTSSGEGWLVNYGSAQGVYKLGGGLRFYLGPNSWNYGDVTPTWSIADGGWHQIVTTYQSGASKLYVDGQLLSAVGGGSPMSVLNVGTLPGSYDEVAVYSKVLTADEVADRWAMATMPSTAVCPVDPSPGPYAAKVLADDPALYLRGSELLSEPDGRAVLDHSSHCRHATRGPSTDAVSGAIPNDDDPGLRLTQAGQWAMTRAGDGLPSGSRSVELWVKTTSSGEGWLVNYGSAQGVYKLGGGLRFYLGPNSWNYGDVTPTWSIADGGWHQIVTTYQSGASKLYVDGQLLSAVGGGSPMSVLNVGTLPGSYDEVAVYSKVLTADEVADRWAMATMPSTAVCPVDPSPGPYAAKVLADDPALYLRGSELLSEPDGRAVLDHSSHCRHATRGPSTDAVSGAIPNDDDPGLRLTQAGQWAMTRAGDGLPSGSRSVELWVKTTSSGEGWLVNYGSAQGVYKLGGGLRFYLGPNSWNYGDVTPTWSIADGGWHQIVTTYQSGASKLYVDGQLLSAVGGGSPMSVLNVGTLPGSYDEVAVYSKVLTADEVADRWAMATMPSTAVCPVDPSPGPYAAKVLADDPALYLRGSELLSEPDGRAVLDHSSHCRHATRGPSTDAVSGAIPNDDDPGLRLTQAGQWAMTRAGDGLPSGSRSVELWVKTTSSGEGWLVNYGSAQGVYKLGGGLRFYLGPNSWNYGDVTPTWSIADGGWHQIVTTYQSGASKLYVDGQLLSAVGGGSPMSVLNVGTLPGSYDEVAVYSKVLTADEVADRWATGNSGSELSCPIIKSSGHAETVLREAPELYLRLGEALADDDARLATDSSGNCRHGTYGPAAQATSPGVAAGDDDGAVRSDQPTWTVARGSDGLPAGARTVEMWVKSTSSGEGWLVNYGSAQGVYKLGGGLRFYLGPNSWNYADLTPPSPISNGAWHQIVTTYDAGTSGLYVDGVLVRSIGGGSPMTGLYVGALPGSYDEIAVYGRAFSAAEIGSRWAQAALQQTTTTLDAATDDWEEGDQVGLTANVQAPHALAEAPTGTVTFVDGSTTLDTVPLGADGKATYSGTFSAGNHSIVARYSGDTRYVASRNRPALERIVNGAENTTTVLAVDPAEGSYGTGFVATATVAGAGAGGSSPGGFVAFYVNGTRIGSGELAEGVATVALPALTPGTAHVKAVYGGDAVFATSSDQRDVAVSKASRAPVLEITPNPAAASEGVRLAVSIPRAGQATVAASGRVQISSESGPVASLTLGSNGTATTVVDDLPIGTHTLTASYAGDARYAPRDSASVQVTITKATTTTTLLNAPEPAPVGKRVTLTAQVRATRPTTVKPGGSVTFAEGETVLGQAPVDEDGNAKLSVDDFELGQHSLTASYSGDARNLASVSPVRVQTMVPAVTVVLSAPAVVKVGEQTAIVVTVAPGTGQGPTPTGAVTIKADGTTLGTATLDAAGKGTLTMTFPTSGGRELSAEYPGSSRYGFGATEAPTHLDVVPAATTTELTSTPNPAGEGAAVKYTVTVKAVAPGGGVPQGYVALILDGGTIATLALDSAGKASFTDAVRPQGIYQVKATYGGSANHDPSMSSVLTQYVSPRTETTLTSTPNPSVLGNSVTFTATVDAVDLEAVPPGTVTFTNTSTNATLGSASIGSDGKASITVNNLAVGTYPVVATYSGGSGYGQSSSATYNHEVKRVPTQVALTASPASPVNGQQVTMTATVTPDSQAFGAPTGTVTFKAGTATLGQASLQANGTAVLAKALDAGTYSLTATYDGNGSYDTATSAAVERTVAKADVAVSVVASPSPSAEGDPVTATVKVAPVAPGAGVPSGTVSLSSDGVAVGSSALSDGSASFPLTPAGGDHVLKASYAGDDHFQAGQSAEVAHHVGHATTTALTATPEPSIWGQTVTLTATVSSAGGTPAGTVTFRDGTTPLGQAQLDASGVATLQTADLSTGKHAALTATYAGAGDFASSTSDDLEHTVSPAPTTLTLTSAPATPVYGQQVTLTATVGVPAPGRGPPVGFVSFSADGTTIGTATLNDHGVATLVTSSLHAGARSLTAAYGGLGNHATSTGSKTLTIGKAAAFTFVTASPSPSVLGTQVTFRIVPDAPYAGTPTGTVTLYDGTTALGTRTLDPNGEARISISSLTQGDHQIHADYAGDTNFIGGSSPTSTHTVNPGLASSVSLTSSAPGRTAFGEQVTFTATVTGSPDRAVSGFVTFTDNGQSVGTVTLDGNGQAKLITQVLGVGSHQVGALYGGDGYYFQASAIPVAHEITPSRQLFFAGPAQELTAGVTSAPYTVRLENRDGPVAAGAGGLVVTLQASAISGKFVNGAGTQITQVTIPAGQSTATFRYRDTRAGSPYLAVSAPAAAGVGPRTQQQTVVPGPLHHLALSPTVKTVVPGGSQSYRVEGRDEWDNSRGEVTSSASLAIAPSGTCTGNQCTVGAAGDYTVLATVGSAAGNATLISDNPPVPSLSANVTSGIEALDVTFDISASDVDGDNLTWTIDYGDGTPVTQPQPLPSGGTTVTHTYLECRSCVAVLHVSDGKTDPAANTTLKIDVARNDALFQANAGDPVVAEVNRPVQLDGSASLPGSPLIQSYQWNFGDGSPVSTSASPVRSHVYTTPGTYHATLTVSGHGRSSTSQVQVEVTPPSGGGAVVAVTTGGSTLSNATVVVKDAENQTFRATEYEPGSYRIDALPDGPYTAYVAAPGYLPATVPVTVVGGSGYAQVALKPGEVGFSELITKRLTPQEAIDYGVDPDAPGNQNIYQFQLTLSFEDKKIDFAAVSTDNGFVQASCNGQQCAGGGGGGDDVSVDFGRIGLAARASGNHILWIVMPGQAKWMKEMFDVQLLVTNLGDPAFSFEDGTATLNLPAGLSLADMSGSAQRLSQSMPVVPGGQTRSVHWIVRGDTEGEYTLTADYTGVLQPVGTPVHLTATTNEANRIKVWGGSALRMTVDAEDSAVANHPYNLKVSLTNVADVPVYNPMVTLLPSPEVDGRKYVFQPRQQLDQGTDQIDPGQTFTTRDYTVVPAVDGAKLNLEESTVLKTGGNQFIPSEIVSHPAEGIARSVTTKQTSLGVEVSWDASPGAVGYEIYSTPFHWVNFPGTPIKKVGAGQLSATLPNVQDGYGLVAVSTIYEAPDGSTYHGLDHEVPYLGGYAFERTNPCLAFGDAPNGALAGNYVTSSEDLSVATAGPPLQVRRTYNSSSEREGWFGTGWNSDYEMGWEPDAFNNVAVRLPDGRCLYFMRNEADSSVFDPPPGEFGRLLADGQGGYVFISKDRTKYHLDSDQRLRSVTDIDGRRVDLAYGAGPDGRLQSATDRASGRKLTYTWTESGRVASVSSDPVSTRGAEPAALTWRYYYDGGGRLVAACDPRDNAENGTCTRYQYDDDDGNPDRRLTAVVNPEGNTDAALTYDAEGRLTTRADGLGKATTYTYPEPPEGVETRVVATTPLGRETTTDYDEFHRTTRVRTGGGGVTRYEYDAHGYPSKVIDPNGNTKLTTHDARGNLLELTNGEGETTRMSYDENDNLLTVRDGRSSSATDPAYLTSLEYDAFSHVKDQKAPNGDHQQWTYTGGAAVGDEGVRDGTEPGVGPGFQPPGLVEKEIDPRGKEITHTYDANGDLRKSVSATGLVTEYTYDGIGRKLTETVTDESVTPSSVATTTYSYDEAGNLLTTTGPAVANAVTGVTHQLRTTSVYDRNNNVTEVRAVDVTGGDPSRVTTFAFDNNDRVISVTDAENGTTSREYDDDGNVVEVTDAENRRQTAVYDDEARPLKVTQVGYLDGLGGSPRNVVVSEYTYDAGGRPSTITDPNGRVRRFVYDHADRLLSTKLEGYTDLNGSTRDVVLEQRTYDDAGQVTQIKTGGGLQTVNQVWDASGRLVSTVLDPGGLNRTTTYGYDPAGNVTTETRSQNGRTETLTTEYNNVGQPTSRTVEKGANDLVSLYTYDRRGNLRSETDPSGNTTDYEYDLLNRQIRTITPAVAVESVGGGTVTQDRPTESFGYNTYGDATRWVDTRGNTTRSTYDQLGRQLTITHPSYTPAGGQQITPIEQYTYDKVGNLTKAVDRRGFATTYVFDSMNRVAKQTDPQVGQQAAGVSTFTYDDAGNVLAAVDPVGARTEMTYDARDQVRTRTQVVRRSGAPDDRYTTTYGYDDLGNAISVEDPLHKTLTFQYSAASEVLAATDQASKTTTYAHDVAGRVTRITDPLGRARGQVYDLAGRLTAVTSIAPNGAEVARTSYALDPNGNVTTVTRPKGNATSYTYDSHSQLTKVEQPTSAGQSSTTLYGYDKAGNVTRMTDGRGNVTTYTYNPWNLPEDTVEPSTPNQTDLPSRTFSTYYDGAGLPVKETQPDGVTIARTFDELGRLTKEDGTSTVTTIPAAARTFGYDKVGNMTSAGATGSATGPNLNFTYDDRRLMTGATGASGTASYTYDAAGQLLSRTDSAGTATFTWDARGDVKTATDPLTGVTATNTYDDARQLTGVAYTGGATRSLTWDDRGRLTANTLKKSDGTTTASATTYGYDDNDNLTSQVITQPSNSSQGTHTYSYDLADRVISWKNQANSTRTFGYDQAGNRTSVSGTTYSYDARNRVTGHGQFAYSWSARGTMTRQSALGVPQANYEYDALGRTTKVTGAVIQPIPLTYDSLDRVTSRRGTAFAYEGTSIDPVSDGSTLISRDPYGSPMAQKTGTGTPSLIQRNRHGDLTALFAGNGTIAGSRVYDPWGNVATTAGTASPLGFQGDYTDPNTHDVWMGARWYQVDAAQFTTRDTVFGQLKTPVSLNRYSYGLNNPLGMFDPDGHMPEWLASIWDQASAWIGCWAKALWGGVTALGAEIYHMSESLYDSLSTKFTEAIDGAKQAISKAMDVVGQTKAVLSAAWQSLPPGLRQGLKILVPLVAGAVATGACMAGSAGLGTPACLMLGGAISGGLSGLMNCGGKSAGECARDTALEIGAGALTGWIGGSGGRLLSNLARGGLANATYDAIMQFGTTGKVDFKQVAGSFLTGAALVGALHLGAGAGRTIKSGINTRRVSRMTEYMNGLDTQAPGGSRGAREFQIANAGETEYRVGRDKDAIWADGLDSQTQFAIEVKYVEKPKSSPYVPGSSFPDAVRAKVNREQEQEMRRYSAAIKDQSNPIRGLRLVTNNAEASEYFAGLMRKYDVPGAVVLIRE